MFFVSGHLWLFAVGISLFFVLVLCLVNAVWHCDYLVVEEGKGCFDFIGW